MKKFTLLELLVVVAVIAVLLSILLPSLSHARARTKNAVCMANLRQYGILSHKTIQTPIPKGKYSRTSTPRIIGNDFYIRKKAGRMYSWNFWRLILADTNGYELNKLFTSLRCPAYTASAYSGYSPNFMVAYRWAPYISQIQNPTDLLLMGEPERRGMISWMGLGGLSRFGTDDTRHGYKAMSNGVFFDLHVSSSLTYYSLWQKKFSPTLYPKGVIPPNASWHWFKFM